MRLIVQTAAGRARPARLIPQRVFERAKCHSLSFPHADPKQIEDALTNIFRVLIEQQIEIVADQREAIKADRSLELIRTFEGPVQ